ncbi:hypothetical protein B0H14DRAFT_3427595 [Mycena olivaceomarginata]|nr:hypothetical protein B0H14DRAFT_3427595 [Mycena olivaceomarginata]
MLKPGGVLNILDLTSTITISDSDDAPATQAPETRRSHQSDPAQDLAQLWDHDIDDADSEKSDGSNHEEHNDFEVEDEEDLQDVLADVLSRTFAQEQARWRNDDGLDAERQPRPRAPVKPSVDELRIHECPSQ